MWGKYYRRISQLTLVGPGSQLVDLSRQLNSLGVCSPTPASSLRGTLEPCPFGRGDPGALIGQDSHPGLSDSKPLSFRKKGMSESHEGDIVHQEDYVISTQP